MQEGFVALYRKFLHNPLWTERRVFSKAEAWLDILMNVRWEAEPQTVVIGNKTLICRRGESLKSLDTWAARWRWSKARVRRVLLMYQRCSMIDTQNETVTTRITVCNFSKYQDLRNASETQMKRKRNASETHSAPEEPSNQVTKEPVKEKPPLPPLGELPGWLNVELWNDYRAMRKQIRSPMTARAEQLLQSKLRSLMDQGFDQAELLQEAIVRNWKSVFAPKGNGSKPNPLDGKLSAHGQETARNMAAILERRRQQNGS